MKPSLRISLIFAAALLIGAGSAKADTMLYFTLTGSVNATFELPSSPVMDPTFCDVGYGFIITPTDLKIGGVASDDFLAFYDGMTGGGGLAAFSDSFDAGFSLTGSQIYHGSELVPFFTVTGNKSLELNDQSTDLPGYRLTISTSPSSVPEPSTILLLAAGLLPLGLLAKRLF